MSYSIDWHRQYLDISVDWQPQYHPQYLDIPIFPKSTAMPRLRSFIRSLPRHLLYTPWPLRPYKFFRRGVMIAVATEHYKEFSKLLPDFLKEGL